MVSLSRPHRAILALRASPIRSRDGSHTSDPATVELTVLPASTTAQLFAYTDAPANLSDPDPAPVNLGVKFDSSQSGLVTGLKYYKGIGDTGTHVGSLWTSDGTLLASATFTNETASGWQYVTFANPVAITAGTTYVASYSSNGHYASSGNFAEHTNGILSTSGPNAGVYTFGTGPLFPASVSTANYWVDVLVDPPGGGGISTGAVTEDVAMMPLGTSRPAARLASPSSPRKPASPAIMATAFSRSWRMPAWTYTANNNQTAIQQLRAGQSITNSFTAVSSDGTSRPVVTVIITGTDDSPVQDTHLGC